jgi:hypothetical protein
MKHFEVYFLIKSNVFEILHVDKIIEMHWPMSISYMPTEKNVDVTGDECNVTECMLPLPSVKLKVMHKLITKFFS